MGVQSPTLPSENNHSAKNRFLGTFPNLQVSYHGLIMFPIQWRSLEVAIIRVAVQSQHVQSGHGSSFEDEEGLSGVSESAHLRDMRNIGLPSEMTNI